MEEKKEISEIQNNMWCRLENISMALCYKYSLKYTICMALFYKYTLEYTICVALFYKYTLKYTICMALFYKYTLKSNISVALSYCLDNILFNVKRIHSYKHVLNTFLKYEYIMCTIKLIIMFISTLRLWTLT